MCFGNALSEIWVKLPIATNLLMCVNTVCVRINSFMCAHIYSTVSIANTVLHAGTSESSHSPLPQPTLCPAQTIPTCFVHAVYYGGPQPDA